MRNLKSLFWTDAPASEQRPTPTPSAVPAPPASAPPAAQAPDLAGIATSVEQRLAALEASIAAEQRRVHERRQARAEALQAGTAKVHAEIKALEDRAAKLRTHLAAATAEAQTQETEDQRQLATFVERSRAEAGRLAALRDFIARGGSQ